MTESTRSRDDGAGVRSLEQLHKQLVRQRRSTLVGSRPEVADALRWLARAQRRDGYWSEPDDEGTTALCAIAVAEWSSTGAPEASDAKAAAATIGTSRLGEWLETRAREGFSTPWYTAVNLHALCDLGQRSGDSAGRLFEELVALDPEDEQAWLKRGHHAAQIIGALRAYRVDEATLRRWLDSTVKSLEHTTDVYVAGQIIHALLEENVPAPDLAGSILRLCHYLEDEPLSRASFLQYAPALQALGAVRSTEPKVEEVVSVKTAELLGKYPETGWYHDPECFAWSLMALYECEEIKEVALDIASLNISFAEARRNLVREHRRSRRYAAFYSAVLSAEVTTVAFFAIFEVTSFVVTSILVGIGIAATLPFVLKKLVDYLR